MKKMFIEGVRAGLKAAGTNATHQETLDALNYGVVAFLAGAALTTGATLTSTALVVAGPLVNDSVGPIIGTLTPDATFLPAWLPNGMGAAFGGVVTGVRMLTGPQASTIVTPSLESEVPVSLQTLNETLRQHENAFQTAFAQENPHLVEEDQAVEGAPLNVVPMDVVPVDDQPGLQKKTKHDDFPDFGKTLNELFKSDDDDD